MKILQHYTSFVFRIRHSELRVLYPFFAVALCFMLFAYAGCKMPNDGIPIYMKVDSVSVLTTPEQGVGSHNITDVWVEANTDNLAAYAVPCNFPVLQENEVRFVMNAGIKETGQSGVRVTYPFYLPDTFTITGVRGQQYTHNPVFEYRKGTRFAFIEDFDFSNRFTGTPADKVKIVDRTNDPNVDPVHGGFRCLKIEATTDSSVIASSNDYDLPEGQEIWLEVDYKAEVPFYIGFYGLYAGGGVADAPALFVNPQTNWNKVYVKLSLLVAQTRADTYAVYFEALRPYGSAGGSVYIDNVKLVHF